MNKKAFFYRYLPFLIIVIFLAGTGFLYYKFKTNSLKDQNYFKEPVSGESGSNSNSPESATISEPTVYTDPNFGFSVKLPTGFTASRFEEGEGSVVLIKASEINASYEMQIFIREFIDDSPITISRIQKEIPDLKFKDPITVLVGRIDAVSFIDTERNTREIWFKREGNLFQILAQAVNDNQTGKIMESWNWQ